MNKRISLVLSWCVVAMIAASIDSAFAANRIVAAGGDLQAALNAAQPGDTILLPAGAIFTGNFTLPAKNGTVDITIRSAAPDSSLPAAGVRITPEYAAALPKIRSTSNGPALRTASGASHWALLFLEILPAPATSTADLVEFGTTGTAQNTLSAVPQHLTIDRCYLHGDPVTGQRRGLALNSGDTRVLNSYFADFKGVLQDTQAIAGWNGPGPFLIDNNYLEAAGENIMFGGSDPNVPNLIPSDIVISHNLISKPLAWMNASWTVKNLVELKNAQNVTLTGNILENHWVAGQQGSAIVLTPRNQSNTAPWSAVRHVVVQDNLIRHVSSVFNILGYDNLAPSQQTEDITIRNNLLYDVNTKYGVAGQPVPARLAMIGAGPRDVRFDHNTVDNNGSSTIFFYAGATPTGVTTIDGFVLTNNLLRSNSWALFGDTVGAGVAALARYAPTGIVLDNTFAGASAKSYPAGNDFPSIAQWLADFMGPASGDYRLAATSISHGAGTDGKDLGVDFVELNAALSLVPPTLIQPPPVGTTCGQVTLDHVALSVGSGEANWVINVSAPTADCTWTATTDVAWLVVKSTSPAAPKGSGFVKVRALADAVGRRVGHFMIGGAVFTVTQ